MNTFLTIAFLSIINQYQITGDWGTKGVEAKPAEWIQCIKLVAGTDSDVEFCDHQFDPFGELDYDEVVAGYYEAEYMDGR